MNRNLKRSLAFGAVLGALTLSGSALTGAQAQDGAGPPLPEGHKVTKCFYANQWEGWKAANDHVMYVRVNMHDVYRIDFASSCHEMTWSDAHLITTFRGSDSVCTPLDLDIKVSDGGPGGIPEPCIASGITQLSPEEAAAIPKQFRP
jgi:hypothetical protein